MLGAVIHFFARLDTIAPLTLVWVVLLIDCLWNKSLRGSQKLGWFLFILVTHLFGALCYFFIGPAVSFRRIFAVPDRRPRKYVASRARRARPRFYEDIKRVRSPQELSSSPLEQEKEPQDYRQGYQARSSPYPPQNEPQYIDPHYEQPRASYPEMKQEQ